MTPERISPNLESIRRAAGNALSFMDGRSLDDFLSDLKTQAAIAMCLIVIGEGANKIAQEAPDFVAAHPDWPWDRIRGFRNRVVHAYDRLEPAVVWSTVNDYLPELLSAIDSVGDFSPNS